MEQWEAEVTEKCPRYTTRRYKPDSKKDDINEKREWVKERLEKRKNKLWDRFSEDAKDMFKKARKVMQQCQDELEANNAEVAAGLPAKREWIINEYTELVDVQTAYIEENFPEGIAGLDNYDDGERCISWEDWKAACLAAQEEALEANETCRAEMLASLKENMTAMLNAKVREAIEAVKEDVCDDEIAFLEDEEVDAFRAEMAEACDAYLAEKLPEE